MKTWRLAAVLIALGSALAATAPAAVSIRPPAGVPDPKAMVLVAKDLGGAKVVAQRYYKDQDIPSVISYEREFEEATFGSTELLSVNSTADVGATAPQMARFLTSTKQLFGSAEFRATVKELFAEELGEGFGAAKVQVGRPRTFGVGAGSFDVLITMRVLGIRVDSHIAAFRVDRVIGSLVVVGGLGERVSVSVVKRLATTMAKRMATELGPKSTVPPTISGSPQVGQTLTASTGSWRGNPSRFTYQWQRCNTAGAGCAAIAGATAQSYLLTDADAGWTIRVVVTASTATGSGRATSAQTGVVTALGAPASTAPPAISGSALQGQTLTAGTGAWTNSPTSFSFMWQRCDASGASCADIPGATAGTYVVTSSDAGSTIRVAVTARNAVGENTAASLPTAVIP